MKKFNLIVNQKNRIEKNKLVSIRGGHDCLCTCTCWASQNNAGDNACTATSDHSIANEHNEGVY